MHFCDVFVTYDNECANFASVTQKRSISDSTDILPMWEEKLEETRAKEAVQVDRFMCSTKCFNSLSKSKF